MKEVQEMDNEKTLESVPSATQEKIKVESINVIVEEIGGKPYYELRYRVVGDDFCHIGYRYWLILGKNRYQSSYKTYFGFALNLFQLSPLQTHHSFDLWHRELLLV